jgi:protein TonB
MYPAPERKAVKPAIKEAAAHLSTCAKPERSLASVRNAEEGTSIVAFLVDSDGAVLDSKVERSSGYPHLDTAARDAIRLCKFTPAERNGAPYKSWTSVAYVWS